jgi:hypothetical protein
MSWTQYESNLPTPFFTDFEILHGCIVQLLLIRDSSAQRIAAKNANKHVFLLNSETKTALSLWSFDNELTHKQLNPTGN